MCKLEKVLKYCFVVFCLMSICMTKVHSAENCTLVYGKGIQTLCLATGSPGELGLVETLAETFNKSHDVSICWIKAGSGASLQLLKDKQVDLIMVHAPDAEKAAVQEGWAAKRRLIGSNEFYIVGPDDDPAKIAHTGNASQAYKKIATARAVFFSRGDNSGTHKKEMAIWKMSGIEPRGSWYRETHTFMMATLKQADKIKGYFMTDSSTWVAAKKEMKHLKVLFQGDPFLVNTYHALCVPKGATAAEPLATTFIDFVVSEAGQKIIREYGVKQFGEGLYNDAVYAEKYE